MFEPNIANSVFPGLNDNGGIMLCGYEWGFSKNDQESLPADQHKRSGVSHVFSNKAAEYGEVANGWKYDQRIVRWFELFGHELNRVGTGEDFEKCILQTNWCDTQDHKMRGDYWTKLLADDQVNNFIAHIDAFKPRLIFFFGSQIIKILQTNTVLPRFKQTMGEITAPLSYCKKPFAGRTFNVAFQSFGKCKVVCFPHPSGSHGLSDNYIRLFSEEVGRLLEEFKEFRRIR